MSLLSKQKRRQQAYSDQQTTELAIKNRAICNAETDRHNRQIRHNINKVVRDIDSFMNARYPTQKHIANTKNSMGVLLSNIDAEQLDTDQTYEVLHAVNGRLQNILMRDDNHPGIAAVAKKLFIQSANNLSKKVNDEVESLQCKAANNIISRTIDRAVSNKGEERLTELYQLSRVGSNIIISALSITNQYGSALFDRVQRDRLYESNYQLAAIKTKIIGANSSMLSHALYRPKNTNKNSVSLASSY